MPNGLDRFILGFDLANSPPQSFSPHFQLRHPVLAPPSGVETKLNVGAQLQTFPYPTISKPLLSSNGFWAKSFLQTLQLQERDGLTNWQKSTFLHPIGAACHPCGAQNLKIAPSHSTGGKETKHFWLSRRRAMPKPHRTWQGDRGHRACSCTSKRLRFDRVSPF